MKTCQNCGVEFDIPRRTKFCSVSCKDKKHWKKHQIKLLNSPNRREVLDAFLMKRRVKRGIPLDLPIRKVAPKGSGYTDKMGYRVIHKKGHPNAHNKGAIREHIYIMSEHIGRPLKKHESVHHINGIRSDNRIENLELWSKSQPSGQRLEDKIVWCIDFLKDNGYKIEIAARITI